MISSSLGDAMVVVRAAAAAPAAGLPDAQVVEELLAARELADAAEALYLARLEVFHARGLGQADGLSTRSWLRAKARVSPVEATRAIKVATGLTELPQVREALVSGVVRPGHAHALVDAATLLGVEVINETARALVAAAVEVDPGTLRKTLNGFGAAVDSPGAVRAAEHRDEGRWLTIASTFDGAVSIEGLLGAGRVRWFRRRWVRSLHPPGPRIGAPPHNVVPMGWSNSADNNSTPGHCLQLLGNDPISRS